MLIDLLSNTGYIIVNKEIIKKIRLHEAILLGELCSEYIYVIALMVRDNIPSNTITRTKLIDIYKLCKNKQIEYENTNKEISDFISYYYKSVINSGKKNEI